MGKIITEKITRFDGGMTTRKRRGDFSFSQMIKNFDANTDPNRLIPFRSSEDGDSASATSQKQAFTIALRTGTTYNLYALGVKSGTAIAEILYKSDLTNNAWITPNNNQSSAGATSFNLFVFYKKTGLIYGARAGTHIWAFDPTGSAAWNDTEQAITYTNIAQGLVHSKDDILYIPYDNKIASNNNGSWDTTALTLPSDRRIASICEYGNYLAIATQPSSSTSEKSIVYLWDRDSSDALVSESIDWGNNNLQILENLDGILVGISYINDTFQGKIIFRQYTGAGKSTVFKELISDAVFTVSDLPIDKQKIDNRLYFLMTITLNGVRETGVWKLGKVNDKFALTLERVPNNDTALGASSTLQGFFFFNDYLFIAYEDSGYKVTKTNDQNRHNHSCIYESLIFNGGDSSINKSFKKATVIFEPLPSQGQIVLKYKKNEETSFTTIFTHNTDNSVRRTTNDIEAGIDDFYEIVFRIESTEETGSGDIGVITGFKLQYELKSDDVA